MASYYNNWYYNNWSISSRSLYVDFKCCANIDIHVTRTFQLIHITWLWDILLRI